MTQTTSPILVTGSHRSGSTWVGRMLATAPGVGFIYEPFNPALRTGVNPEPFQYWYTYLCETNAGDYNNVFDRIIRYHYPLVRNLLRTRTFMDAANVIRDQGAFWWHGIMGHRPLIKDPLAFFSADWLCHRFNMAVIVVIRHPAAFCSSLKIKKWGFPFEHLLEQPLLLEKFLDKYEEQIRQQVQRRNNLIDQAILLWNCIHHTINIYRQEHPDWLFVRHEDLSLDPVEQFRRIYEKFGLEFTAKAEQKILASTGTHNPAEQRVGKELARDSKKNIKNWKNRLTAEEIATIRRETAEVSALFYSEEEW